MGVAMTDWADCFSSVGKPKTSDLERRVEELERRVRELEARPVYVPVPQPWAPPGGQWPQYWPPPVITFSDGTAKPVDSEYRVRS